MCCGDVEPKQQPTNKTQNRRPGTSQISRRRLIKFSALGAATLALPRPLLGRARRGPLNVGIPSYFTQEQTQFFHQAASTAGVNINVHRFSSRGIGQAALEMGDVDIYVGLHPEGEDMLSRGIIEPLNALPAAGGMCQASLPQLCNYLLGNYDDVSSHPDFGAEMLCTPLDCPECDVPNPPEWCRVVEIVQNNPGFNGIDLLQVATAGVFNGKILPYGMPLWWDFYGFFADPNWFRTMPTTIREVEQFAARQPNHVYTTRGHLEVFDDFAPSPIPQPFTTQGSSSIRVLSNFNPILSLLSGGNKQVALVSGAVGFNLALQLPYNQKLYLLPLTDYRPGIYVTAMYISPVTDQPEACLYFMHEAGRNPGRQLQGKVGGDIFRLPALAEMLDSLAHGSLKWSPGRQRSIQTVPDAIKYAATQGFLIP